MSEASTRLRHLSVDLGISGTRFQGGNYVPLEDALAVLASVESGLGTDRGEFMRGYRTAVLVGRMIARGGDLGEVRPVMLALLDGIARFLATDDPATSTDIKRGKPSTSEGGPNRTGVLGRPS